MNRPVKLNGTRREGTTIFGVSEYRTSRMNESRSRYPVYSSSFWILTWDVTLFITRAYRALLWYRYSLPLYLSIISFWILPIASSLNGITRLACFESWPIHSAWLRLNRSCLYCWFELVGAFSCVEKNGSFWGFFSDERLYKDVCKRAVTTRDICWKRITLNEIWLL